MRTVTTVFTLGALLLGGAALNPQPANARERPEVRRAEKQLARRAYHHRRGNFERDRKGRPMGTGDYVGRNGVLHRNVNGYYDRDGRFRPYRADVDGWYDKGGTFHVR